METRRNKTYSKAILGLLFFTIVYFGTYDVFQIHLFSLLEDVLVGTEFEWFIGYWQFIWNLMGLIFIAGVLLGIILAYQKKEPRSDIEYVQF